MTDTVTFKKSQAVGRTEGWAVMSDIISEQWAVAIIEDRYGGAYSGGRWIAIAQADTAVFNASSGEDYETRAEYLLSEGPHGGDPDAMLTGILEKSPWFTELGVTVVGKKTKTGLEVKIKVAAK